MPVLLEPSSRRTSAKWPATAAAAAMAGETRWVRPPRPCRPSKLRLLVLGAALAGPRGYRGFMPRHMEQPAVAPFRTRRRGRCGPVPRPRPGPDLGRARDHQGPQPVADLPARQHDAATRRSSIRAVGAGADEHRVDRDVLDRGARGQAHVGERPPPELARRRVRERLGVGDPSADRHRLGGGRPPGDRRLQGSRVDDHGAIEPGAGVTAQLAPGRHRGVPGGAPRRVRPSLHVGDGGGVGGDHPGPAPALDGEVAEGHPLLHREVADRLPGILDDVPGGAGGADGAEHAQGHVLGGDPRRQRAVDPSPPWSAAGTGAGTGWPGRARPPRCRSPGRRLRRRHGWRCGSRRRR